jgi:putative component of membrane protein insertase Oxa1/YidC/SpoIIIJ protein YidD
MRIFAFFNLKRLSCHYSSFCQYTSIIMAFLLGVLPATSQAALSSFEAGEQPWGIDCELSMPLKKAEIPIEAHSFSSRICLSMIRFFQQHISPIDGPRSSYFPTSSQYTLLAIKKYGVMKGVALGCDRLMRENADTWVYPLTDAYGATRKLDPVP